MDQADTLSRSTWVKHTSSKATWGNQGRNASQVPTPIQDKLAFFVNAHKF